MSRDRTVYNFLRRSPQPVKLLVFSSDGDERTVVIGDNRTRWADAESGCAGAVRVEAQDGAGNVLRVLSFEDGEPVGSVSAIEPMPDPKRGNESLDALASAVARITEATGKAVDQACQRQSEAHQAAFNALLAVVTAQGELMQQSFAQLSELQDAWQELVRNADPNAPSGAMTDKLAMQLAGPMLANMMAAQQNGKG